MPKLNRQIQYVPKGAIGGSTVGLSDIVGVSPYQLFYSDNTGAIQELAHGTSGHVLTSNGASANPSWQAASGSGLTNFQDNGLAGEGLYNGTVTFSTGQFGINIAPETGTNPVMIGTGQGDIQFNNSVYGYSLYNYTVSQIMSFLGEDSGSALTIMQQLDPDGSVDLYYNGGRSISTQTFGMELISNGSTYNGISGQQTLGSQDWQIGMDTAASQLDLSAWKAGDSVVIRTTVSSSGDHVHLRANPGTSTELLYDNQVTLETNANGIDITSPSDSPNVSLFANGGLAGYINYFTDDNLYIDNRQTLGDMVFRVSNTTTSDRTGVRINRSDGSVYLYYGGGATQTLETQNQGIVVNHSTAAGTAQVRINGATGQSSALNFSENGAAGVKGQIIYDATNNELEFRTVVTGEQTRFFNDVGGDQLVLKAGGAVEIYYNGTNTLETTSTGIQINDIVADIVPGINSNCGFRAYNTIGGMHTNVLATTGGFRLGQTSTLGTYEESWIEADRNGEVRAYNNGTKALSTTADGIDVFSTGAAASNAILGILDGDSEQAFLRKRGDTGGFEIRNQEHGGTVSIQAEDTGGAARNLIVGDPDGPVDLYYAGSQKAETINEGFRINEILHTPTDTELTIATGAITVTRSYHSVDTEANAATDDLDTINGGAEGAIIILRANNSARTVVVKDGTGNLNLAGDFSLTSITDTITLFKGTGSTWFEISRSDNAA